MCRRRIYFLIQVFFVSCILQTSICQDRAVTDDSCPTPDKSVGKCIFVNKCKPMIDFLHSISKPISQFIKDRLNSYSCGYKNGKSMVCCPSTTINIVDPSKPTSPPKLDPPDVTNHKNLKLLPQDCGYLDIGDKIRNGINATLNEFPWMALLAYKTERGPEFKCGGTIINDRYILTAAHCLANLEDPLASVRIGEHNILTKIDCEVQPEGKEKCNGPVQDLKFEKVIVHQEYNPSTSLNDIGLVRVAKMNLSIESARPVCLPYGSSVNQRIGFGVVTGWGYTLSPDSGGNPSTILQRVDLPVLNLEECLKAYSAQANVKLTAKQICAGGKEEKGSCFGDSGGPLQVAGYVNGDTRYVQQGVVSFGPKYCGLDGFPGVFTRVTYYMDWILDNLKP